MQKRLLCMLSGCFVALFMTAQFVGAEEELFDRKTASAFLEKGIAHLKSKNLDAAVEALEESVSIAPEAEAYYYLGYAYYMKGKAGDSESRKRAIENFERAYELDPQFSPSKLKPEESAPGADQKNQTPGDTVIPSLSPPKQMLEANAEQPVTAATETSAP